MERGIDGGEKKGGGDEGDRGKDKGRKRKRDEGSNANKPLQPAYTSAALLLL